jgi:hypothetical protein
MMKAAKACRAVLVVVIATGCLEQSAPFVPGDGLLEDALADGETMGGEGLVGGDACRGGSPCPPDADAQGPDQQDWDLQPGDKMGPHDWETGDACRGGSPCPPDADVPEVVPEGAVLKGAVVTSGIGGAWESRPYRASVSWHRNTFVKGE